jgi:hypothetical protein
VLTQDGKVQLKTQGGDLVTIAVDAQSGAIRSINYSDESGPVTENYSDWRTVDGYKLPFKSETVKDGKPAQTAIASDIKINTNLKAEDLSKRP